MGIIVNVSNSGESVEFICDRCKHQKLDEKEIVRLIAKQGDKEIDVWDLCPNCYSEVMDGAISPHLQS